MILLTSLGRIRKSSWNWIFVLCALNSCQVDSRYNFENLADLDLTVTLFEKGIEVPVGKTERISLAQLTSLAGDGLDSVLSESPDGSYTLNYSDSLDLSDQLRSVNFPSVSVLEGIEIVQSKTLDISIDKSCKDIKGERWERSYPLGPVEVDLDISPDMDKDSLDHAEVILPETTVVLKQSSTIMYDVSAMHDFGNFTLIPDDVPEISISLDLPCRDKLSFMTGEDGISFILPSWLVITDPLAIRPASSFSAKTNTITFHGQVPERFSIPVGYFLVRPAEDGHIYGELMVEGEIKTVETVMEYCDARKLDESEVTVVVTMPDMTAKELMLEEDLVVDLDDSFSFTIVDAGSIPSELSYLSEVTLEDTWMECTIEVEGLPAVASGVFDVDLTVQLPSCLSPSTLYLKGRLGNDGKFSAEPVKIEKLSDIDLSMAEDVHGYIHVYGTISTPEPVIELAGMQDVVKATIRTTIGNSEGEIRIGEIVSRCEYDFAYDETVVFDNVPDMLRSPDTCLDIDNPELVLAISGNTNIPMAGSLEIVPWVGGRPGENRLSIDRIELPCSQDLSVTQTRNFVLGGKQLAGLFRQMPDSLKISVRGGVDGNQDCIVEPDADYRLTIAYSLSLPLEIGNEFTVSVSDTLEVGSEITDVMKMATIGLKCDVLNTIPLGMEISISFLDAQGRELRVSEEDVSAAVAAGRGCAQAPSETPVKAVIRPLPDADLDSISSVCITYRLKASDIGGKLNSADYVEADIAAFLPEGITINLREL